MLSSFILKGGAQICPSDPELFSRMCQLMEIYADHPMDLADASLVALAEKIGTKKVLTFDYNDFFAYKIQKGHKYLAIDIIGAKAAR